MSSEAFIMGPLAVAPLNGTLLDQMSKKQDIFLQGIAAF